MSERGVKLEAKTPDFIDGELRPLRDQLFVRPLDPTISRIIAYEWEGKPVRGQVVAVGPGKYHNRHYRGEKDGKRYHTVMASQYFTPTECQVGDIVELGGWELKGYGWTDIYLNGEKLICCQEADVAGIHEPDCDCSDCVKFHTDRTISSNERTAAA